MTSPRSKTRCLPLWLVAGLMVSACQTAVITENSEQKVQQSLVEIRESRLNALQTFQFNGGLGVWTEEESIPARIVWLQSGSDLNLKLSGPLGVGDMQLQDKAGFVTLSRGKTVVTSGTSADSVVQNGLGLTAPVPIEELKQWVRGLPGNGGSALRDGAGRLQELRYTDKTGTRWGVRFKRYQSVDGYSLPTLITASGGKYSVRLVLKNWELNTNSGPEDANQPNNRLSIPGR